MANPAAIRLPGIFLNQQEAIAARRARLLINYGIRLVSVAGSVIIRTTVSNTSAVFGGPAYHLISFLLFLLGVSMLMLGLAADQFPGAARASVAIVRALHHYLFGGGN